jgi:hypothetical protein
MAAHQFALAGVGLLIVVLAVGLSSELMCACSVDEEEAAASPCSRRRVQKKKTAADTNLMADTGNGAADGAGVAGAPGGANGAGVSLSVTPV